MIIIAPISLSLSYLLSASLSSVKSGVQRAFKALGRFRVTIWISYRLGCSIDLGSPTETDTGFRSGGEDVLIARTGRVLAHAGQVRGQGDSGPGGSQTGATTSKHGDNW